MFRNLFVFIFCFSMLPICSTSASAQRQMENLTRGIVAVKQTSGIYVSWRLFGTDPESISFNLYRITDNSEPTKVNEKPITESTNYVDRDADPNQQLQYFVRHRLFPHMDGHGRTTIATSLSYY